MAFRDPLEKSAIFVFVVDAERVADGRGLIVRVPVIQVLIVRLHTVTWCCHVVWVMWCWSRGADHVMWVTWCWSRGANHVMLVAWSESRDVGRVVWVTRYWASRVRHAVMSRDVGHVTLEFRTAAWLDVDASN